MNCAGHPPGDEASAAFADKNGLLYVYGCDCANAEATSD